jgi:hypothetical protein
MYVLNYQRVFREIPINKWRFIAGKVGIFCGNSMDLARGFARFGGEAPSHRG